MGIIAFNPQGNSAGLLSPGLAGGFFAAGATPVRKPVQMEL